MSESKIVRQVRRDLEEAQKIGKKLFNMDDYQTVVDVFHLIQDLRRSASGVTNGDPTLSQALLDPAYLAEGTDAT